MGEVLLWLGAVACALGAAAGLLPASRRTRLTGLSLAVVLAPILIAADNWQAPRIIELREQPALLAAVLVVAALAIAGLSELLRRRPVLLVPLLIAALPFRVPVELGETTANLLLPLYVLLAAGLAAAWRTPAPVDRRPDGSGPLRLIGMALAGFVALYALQAGYAEDLSAAVETIGFFLAPFSVLFFLLAEARWDRGTLRTLVVVLAIEGALFAAAAAVQYATGELWWNDKVIAGNEAHAYFRVNSLFWDPNILGRYLAVTMVVLAAVIAYGRRRAELAGCAALFVVLLAALSISFSQSSAIALLAGLLVLAAARWGLLAAVAGGAATLLALGAAVVLIAGGGLSSDTTGRSGLVEGGIELAAERPLVGYGSGSFPAEFEQRFGGGAGVAVESHTEPVTVLAEQGAIGALAYVALIVVSVGGLLVAAGLRWRRRAQGTPLAAALLAAYAVMVTHSLGYAAFFIDPITWALLGAAAAVLASAPVAATSESRSGTQPLNSTV